jgi:hypothetical protein
MSVAADLLRERARHLRELAETIESMPVMRLEHHADDDTWRGPRASLCRSTLAVNQQQLHRAADDLRLHAYRFEHRAAELDVLARSQVGVAG